MSIYHNMSQPELIFRFYASLKDTTSQSLDVILKRYLVYVRSLLAECRLEGYDEKSKLKGIVSAEFFEVTENYLKDGILLDEKLSFRVQHQFPSWIVRFYPSVIAFESKEINLDWVNHDEKMLKKIPCANRKTLKTALLDLHRLSFQANFDMEIIYVIAFIILLEESIATFKENEAVQFSDLLALEKKLEKLLFSLELKKLVYNLMVTQKQTLIKSITNSSPEAID